MRNELLERAVLEQLASRGRLSLNKLATATGATEADVALALHHLTSGLAVDGRAQDRGPTGFEITPQGRQQLHLSRSVPDPATQVVARSHPRERRITTARAVGLTISLTLASPFMMAGIYGLSTAVRTSDVVIDVVMTVLGLVWILTSWFWAFRKAR